MGLQYFDDKADGVLHRTEYQYDLQNRKRTVIDSELRSVQLTFNPAGGVVNLRDGKLQNTAWAYNALGLATNKTVAGTLVQTNSFRLDGRLDKHWSPAMGITSYTYDEAGNLKTVDYLNSVPAPAATFNYDAQLEPLIQMCDALSRNMSLEFETILAHLPESRETGVCQRGPELSRGKPARSPILGRSLSRGCQGQRTQTGSRLAPSVRNAICLVSDAS
ncbi:MAG: hypothetical protein O2960_09080 [Verrucomicrobia bacterium]|nr:hypothetical protein [Verrucomicrobiota bacterium]